MTNPTFDPVTRSGEHVILVRHTAVVGGAIRGEPVHYTEAQPVRKVVIHSPEKHAQHAVSVSVVFSEQGKRTSKSHRAVTGLLTYYTIENESGHVYYDSRQDVPCDMAKFEARKLPDMQGWRDRGYAVTP